MSLKTYTRLATVCCKRIRAKRIIRHKRIKILFLSISTLAQNLLHQFYQLSQECIVGLRYYGSQQKYEPRYATWYSIKPPEFLRYYHGYYEQQKLRHRKSSCLS